MNNDGSHGPLKCGTCHETGKVDIPFSVATTLCMELAQSFLRLHSEGLCYRDISFGNVFFDPSTTNRIR